MTTSEKWLRLVVSHPDWSNRKVISISMQMIHDAAFNVLAFMVEEISRHITSEDMPQCMWEVLPGYLHPDGSWEGISPSRAVMEGFWT